MSRRIPESIFGLLVMTMALAASAQDPAAEASLEGSSWQLLQIQSMDGTLFTPPDPVLYTLRFRSEGRLQVESDCNRAGATWVQDGNQLKFESLFSTQAMCNPGSLHNRFVSNLLGIVSFVRRDNHLYLATYADGAILEFEPLAFSPR